jgi:hypothetical protein
MSHNPSRPLLALALSALALAPAAAQQADCLSISGVNTLTGRVAMASVPSKAAGARGKQEQVFMLWLAAPVCARPRRGARPDEADSRPVDAARQVQLFTLDELGQTMLRRAVGKTVEIAGDLVSAHTEEHHAPLVLRVDTLRTIETAPRPR